MKKIVFIILVIILITLVILSIAPKTKVNDKFDITKEAIENIENIDLKKISIAIDDNEINNESIEFEKNKMQVYTEEEKQKLNITNPVIETIKTEVILKEAEKENINPDFDEEKMKNVADAMYENSDKSISKEEYQDKWVKIQKNNEVKSIYMARIMKKIIANELETDDKDVQNLIEEYKDNLTADNIRKIYDAYVESLASTYNIKIEENENEIYKNYK